MKASDVHLAALGSRALLELAGAVGLLPYQHRFLHDVLARDLAGPNLFASTFGPAEPSPLTGFCWRTVGAG